MKSFKRLFTSVLFLILMHIDLGFALSIMPAPPTMTDFVEQSSYIVEGSIEKYAYRGRSSADGEWGRVFDKTFTGKSRALEAYVKINEVLYQIKSAPKISKKITIPVQLTLEKNKQSELIGKKKLFLLDYTKSQYAGKTREIYTLINGPYELDSRPEIEAEVSKKQVQNEQ